MYLDLLRERAVNGGADCSQGNSFILSLNYYFA